jgi:hypothetical protein
MENTTKLPEVLQRNQAELEALAERYDTQRTDTRKIIENAQNAEKIAKENYERQKGKVAKLSSHYARFQELMSYSDTENRKRIRTPYRLGTDVAVEQDPMYKRLKLVQCLITDYKKRPFDWDADCEVRRLKKAFKNRTLLEKEYRSLEEATHPILEDLLKKAVRYERVPNIFKPLYRSFAFPNYITWNNDGYPSLIEGL